MSESSRRDFLNRTLLAGSAGAALAFGRNREDAAAEDWPTAVGSLSGTRYSALRQINRGNVRDLEVAWTHHTGEKLPGKAGMECTPIVVEGVMYVTSSASRVIALEAATGKPLWRFDPQQDRTPPGYLVNRGVAYWHGRGQDSARRVLLATADGNLFSLDASSGKPLGNFGDDGCVDLRAGMGRDLTGLAYGVTSAPAVFEDLVILGFMDGEGPEPAAPGDIRAFDIHTGKEAWRFHTVPRPGEFGNDTWAPGSWENRGGANAWGGFSLDAEKGIVFAGLGSAAFDFYGGDRKGENLFANCVLALDARTGKRLWHFQVVRHDLLDHDLPTFPLVVSLRQNGRRIEAVAQVTKTGHVFVLDRATGKPVFGVEERDAPASDVPGEQAWPKQIFPLKPPPFAKQKFTEEDITDISPESHEYVLARFRKHRSGPIFTPPSLQGTIVIPGFHGGATWSGASFDPLSGVLYVSANNLPDLLTLTKEPAGKGYPYGHKGYIRFLDQFGYPAIKPPWGTLNAIDLNRGESRWQKPLGEYAALKARGVPQTGTENFGGCINTAGGLVFIGGTRDEKFRAFDKETGSVLWEQQLASGGYATPCTYAVHGRQYIAIAAGGGGKLETPTGDAFVAFRLPG